MGRRANTLYEFGPFRVFPAERLLVREGLPIAVTGKAFDALLVLIQARGHLIEKSKLMAAIWGDTFVEEGNLTVTISVLRKALCDTGNEYIQTIARHGYRFVADVHEIIGVKSLSVLPVPPSSPRLKTKNTLAYRLYLRGRYFWNKRTEDGLLRSIECFNHAIAEDPTYSLAYVGLADAYVLLEFYGVQPTQQAYPNAKAAALRALEIEDSLAEAHTSLGMVSFFCEWSWQDAEKEFRRAITLNPNYALAYEWYAMVLAALGQQKEALSQIQHAQELDPLSLIINTEVGRVLYLSRQYDLAIRVYGHVLDLDPQFVLARTRLGMAYAAVGRFDDAILQFRQAKMISASDPYLEGLLGYAKARSGNVGDAYQILESLRQRSSNQYTPAFAMALVYIGLGDERHAFEWLDSARQNRSTHFIFAKEDSLLDPVRSDPRFGALLHQMRLT